MFKRFKQFIAGLRERPVQVPFLTPAEGKREDPTFAHEKAVLEDQVRLGYKMAASAILDPRLDDWTIADQPGITPKNVLEGKAAFDRSRERYRRA